MIVSDNKPVMNQKQEQLKCPRCDSSNTKFCYYNNYNLSQPRHFCKACKRYWTRGGTLRNVPVGGGCRKNKRVKKNSSIIRPQSNPNPRSNPNPIHFTSSSSAELNSFIYDHMNMNPPTGSLYDNNTDNQLNIQPQLSSLGLSGLMVNNNFNMPLSSFYTGFGSEEAASILASSSKQTKNEYPFLPNDHNHSNYVVNGNYQIDQAMNSGNMNTASDSYMYWNMAMGSSGWPDAMNSSAI